ncbi:MAG TPA: hypothetical protein VFA02_14470 [Pseudacidobacterium sp.]|nr:hypothetical protein [Pseudacidobacterium sp.]
MADAVIDLAALGDDTGTGSATVATDHSAANETQEASQGAEQDGSQQESQQQSDAEKLDGRRGPQNIRNSIKAAAEALPDHAQAFKELGNSYFREQAYKQVFPTVQEATTAKNLIDSVGGLDGISQLQERDQLYTAQDDMLREGNPEVLDDFFEDFPEGAAALAPHYLDRLAKMNPEAFSSAVVPYVVGMLENAGIGNYLASILQEQDPARAKGMVEQLARWYQQQVQGAAQLKTAAPKFPAQDRLKQEQTKIEQERENLFMEGVRTKVNASVQPELDRTIEQYTKQYKLNDTQKKYFQDIVQRRVVEELNNDATYKKQVDLRKASKSRTHDTVASYISGEFNRRLKDAAFTVAKELYGAPKAAVSQNTGVVKAGTPKSTPSGGPIYVSQRPPDAQLDLSRPGAELLLIKGQAYTKDGRFITWRKQ